MYSPKLIGRLVALAEECFKIRVMKSTQLICIVSIVIFLIE